MSDMNNFFVNQDPLLGQTPVQQMNPILYQQIQQMSIKDNIGELDKLLKDLSPAVLNKISTNERFNKLNSEFQANVQQELLALVRAKLNSNPSVVDNIKEQMEIIEGAKRAVESEKEESISEMNDYMKNYSHLTFDDYKKLKNGLPVKDKEEDDNYSEDDNLPSNEDRADDDGDYMGSYYKHYRLDDPCSDEEWAEAGKQWAQDMLDNGEFTEEDYDDAIEHYKYYSYDL